MTTVIAFDVNETLLDLRALDPSFDKLLGSAALRGQWFAQMLQLSFVGGLTGEYVDFSTAQHAALHMLAQRQGKTVTSQQASEMVGRMNVLPAHPAVPQALKRLGETALKVTALVNSLQTVAEEQLINAGIRGYFDGVISADTVRKLKPSPQPYHAVADAFGIDPSEVRLAAVVDKIVAFDVH
jgi:2-haloacid dehalogenase